MHNIYFVLSSASQPTNQPTTTVLYNVDKEVHSRYKLVHISHIAVYAASTDKYYHCSLLSTFFTIGLKCITCET